MKLVDEALRAGRAAAPVSAAARPSVVVAGGGGALGAEVLEQLLGSRAFAHVRVLVTQAFSATIAGLEPLHAERLGVRHLVVLLPLDAALLPQALKAGLANLDEQAVAALGFEHFVVIRSAQAPAGSSGSTGLQRVADLVLAQLRLMTPQALQPARTRQVAALAAAVVRALPASPPGTRVLAPEQVWQAAQTDVDTFVEAWLHGMPVPPRPAGRIRL